MNDTQKPFVCAEKECEMTFTNEDHLNWHKKKHDMMLNLSLAKNDVADQTPTPTRFIRNCEEVGLFQDLQNVNPFDEFFKKAVELAKNGSTLEIPEANSDDTLHTPHILPHVEENNKKISNITRENDSNSQSNEFLLNTIVPIENESVNNPKACNSSPIIIIDDGSSHKMNIKMRIKEALQGKEKQKVEKENYSNVSSLSVVPFQKLLVEEENTKKEMSRNNIFTLDGNREKIREMNRAAQIRCRKRKQVRWKEMEEEILILKSENKRLKLENHKLHHQLSQIKKTVNKRVPPPPPPPLLSSRTQTAAKLKNTANAMVIQLLPHSSKITHPVTDNSLSNMQIYSAPEGTCNGVVNGFMQKNKTSLRKIIPKIIIEN